MVIDFKPLIGVFIMLQSWLTDHVRCFQCLSEGTCGFLCLKHYYTQAPAHFGSRPFTEMLLLLQILFVTPSHCSQQRPHPWLGDNRHTRPFYNARGLWKSKCWTWGLRAPGLLLLAGLCLVNAAACRLAGGWGLLRASEQAAWPRGCPCSSARNHGTSIPLAAVGKGRW